jgi:cell division septal protein FtsQ
MVYSVKYDNKYITDNGARIDNDNNYVGLPTLINFTPDTILEGLIKGLTKVDYEILKMVNEIEYSPYKNKIGNIIDNNRFILKMNDLNTVYIDIPNIKNLNKYTSIIATPDMEKNKGYVYLDTYNEKIVFRSYNAVEKEKADQQKKAEEQEQEKKKETGE